MMMSYSETCVGTGEEDVEEAAVVIATRINESPPSNLPPENIDNNLFSCFDDDNDENLDDTWPMATNHNEHAKSVYEELAEKEEALLMAAQFGKSLIDEKEELERHLENVKRDHQIQIEVNIN